MTRATLDRSATKVIITSTEQALLNAIDIMEYHKWEWRSIVLLKEYVPLIESIRKRWEQRRLEYQRR